MENLEQLTKIEEKLTSARNMVNEENISKSCESINKLADIVLSEIDKQKKNLQK